jgi:hypothetical protein
MEDIFLLILEFFFEYFLGICFEVLVEIGIRRVTVGPWESRTINAVRAVAEYLGLGAVVGWFSVLFFPHSFIRSSRLHGISLIITPTLAGLTMSGIGWLRARYGSSRIRLDTFAYGFVFAFGMSLVRLLFTR